MDSEKNTERQNSKEKFRSDAMVKPIATCQPEMPFVVWPCNEKRRQECCKASNNDKGGREETSRKAQTEVDGQSAERYVRTPALSKARTEQRRLDKCSHGDRSRKGIRSANVSIIYVGETSGNRKQQ